MPSITSGRAALDEALNEPPQRVSPRLAVIEDALGLRRAG